MNKNIKNILKIFQKKGKEILVLGCSGVGKTQFIHSLLDDEDQSTVSNTPTEVSKTFEAKIVNSPFRLVDTVGQEAQPKQRQGIFHDKLQDENLIGIINMVSFGYHEQKTIPSIYVFKGDTFVVNPDFLEENRQKELAYLQEWLPLLHISKVKWVITLMNKMDIWKREEVVVEKYYKEAEQNYRKIFDDTFREHGFHRTHLILPYTSALELFYQRYPIFVGETEKKQIQDNFKQNLIDLIETTA